MHSLTPDPLRIDATKRRLGLPNYCCLGVLEARLAPDHALLTRFRSAALLLEQSSAWEQCVEIAVGMLRLQMRGVHTEKGTLLYVRLGTRSVQGRAAKTEEFVACPGQELTLLSADSPPRSATTSPSGQVIFHLLPGLFALLSQRKGWELQIAWLRTPDGA